MYMLGCVRILFSLVNQFVQSLAMVTAKQMRARETKIKTFEWRQIVLCCRKCLLRHKCLEKEKTANFDFT